MKVGDIPVRGTEQSLNSQRTGGEGADPCEFQKVLQEECRGAQLPAALGRSLDEMAPQAIFQVPPHLMMALDFQNQLDDQSLDGLTRAVDALGGLEKALADPSISPRGIQEHFHGIQNELAGLKSLMSALPIQHPLQSMSEEVNILAHVESVKWNRGDYL